MEKPTWRVRSSQYVVDSPHFRLRKDELELPDGHVIPEYFVRESEGFVIIFALTPADEVVMIHQYRYGNDEVNLELPAGTLAPGEDPLECAKRELAEETGYTSDTWQLIGAPFAEPSRSKSRMYAFLARDARKTDVQNLDASEVIDVTLLPRHEVQRLIHNAQIASLACTMTIYRALDILTSGPVSP